MDLGILANGKMNMTWCALETKRTNYILGCIWLCNASWSRQVNITLHSSLLQPQLENYMQFWLPQYEIKKLVKGNKDSGISKGEDIKGAVEVPRFIQ